jgi:hypothetical protein
MHGCRQCAPHPFFIITITTLILLGGLGGFCEARDVHECDAASPTSLVNQHRLPFLPAVEFSVPFPVYYINMAQSRKRRERIERTFGQLWDLHRFPAIDGANKTVVEDLLGSTNYAALRPFLYETLQREKGDGFYSLSDAELGCLLSHLLAVRQAYLAGHDVVMIIEDDLSPLLM